MTSQESSLMQPKEDNTQKIKITTENKVKDPKKVEQGKGLAEMSRKAKETKKKFQEELNKTDDVTYGYFPIIGVISSLGILFYINYKLSKVIENKRPLSPVIEKEEPKIVLDTFDLKQEKSY